MASGRLAVAKRHIVRRLRDEGFELDRHRGSSHQQWRNYQLRRTVTVPDRPELVGEQVKSIYKQAGWPWREEKAVEKIPESNVKPLVSAVATAPTRAAPPTPPSPQPISVTKPEPVTETTPPVEEVEMKTKAEAKKKVFTRDKDTIELIAQDALENPTLPATVLARRWNMSSCAFARVKTATHGKLSQRTKTMLNIAFGRLSPAGAPDLLKEYLEDPKNIPQAVRYKIEATIPKKVIHALSEPVKPVVEEVKVPATPPEIEPEPPATAMTVIQQEVTMAGYAPRKIGETPVKVGDSSASLKEILEAARRVMQSLGITKVTVPARGEIVIQRREILL